MMGSLKFLRLVVSHTQLYRKLDEYGQDYHVPVKNMTKQECEWMKSQHLPVTWTMNRLRSDNPAMSLLLKVTQQKQDLVSFHAGPVVKS